MIVLDTHAWIWLCSEPKKVSSRARRAIEQTDFIGIAAISCWELAMLVQHGRLALDRDALIWIQQALALPKMTLLAMSPAIAVGAARLGRDFPGDPADRLIASTALNYRTSVVTKDRRIRDCQLVQTVW